MDLSPFKLDIDELITEFAEAGYTTLTHMKKVWLARRFTFIFEASPKINLAFFMQSLYAHLIGYMVGSGSLSHRLGGLYCLYCLYETQPFKPPFRIYLSIGELKGLKNLVVDAKEMEIKVVSSLVKRMLEKNMFLLGFVDLNESSATETVNQLTELQNARIQLAYKRLLDNSQIENSLHMNLGMEVDLNVIKKMSTEYAEAKKLATNEGSAVVDVQEIKHISGDQKLIGDAMGKTVEQWDAQRDFLYQQTGLNRLITGTNHEQEKQMELLQQEDGSFEKELERLLSQA